jgi:hypothetical protein
MASYHYCCRLLLHRLLLLLPATCCFLQRAASCNLSLLLQRTATSKNLLFVSSSLDDFLQTAVSASFWKPVLLVLQAIHAVILPAAFQQLPAVSAASCKLLLTLAPPAAAPCKLPLLLLLLPSALSCKPASHRIASSAQCSQACCLPLLLLLLPLLLLQTPLAPVPRCLSCYLQPTPAWPTAAIFSAARHACFDLLLCCLCCCSANYCCLACCPTCMQFGMNVLLDTTSSTTRSSTAPRTACTTSRKERLPVSLMLTNTEEGNILT